MQRHYKILLIVIILIGSFLRLYNLENKARFIWDEGRDMLAIRHMLVEKDLTLFGPYNEIDGKKDFYGVFHYYLMAPALYLFNYDPLGPAYFTAILGITSIYLCFHLIKQWSSPVAALFITSLYAVSPLVVRYTQWAWNPNTTPFFALLYLLSITKYLKRPSLILATFSGFILGLLFQLHYFTLGLVGCWIYIFFIAKTNRIRNTFIYILAFILPNLTFVFFDLTHEGFYQKIIFDTFLSHGKQNYFSINLLGVLSNPFITTYQTFTYAVANQLMGTIFTFMFFVSVVKLGKDKLFQKQSYEVMVLVAWIGYCIITAVLPNLADDYHTIPYIAGLFYICIYSIRPFLTSRFSLILTVPLIFYLSVVNQPFRTPHWDENMRKIEHTAKLVVQNNPPAKSNFASLVDSDTRGTRFRYFFDVFGVKLMNIDEYPHAETLYVVYKNFEHDFINNPAWELNSFKNGYVSNIGTIDDFYIARIDKKL